MKARFVLISGLLALASVSWADQKIELKGGGGGAEDLLSMTQIPADLSASGGAVKVAVTCTDSNGKTYQQGEKKYDSCMNQNRAGAALKPHPSNAPFVPGAMPGAAPGQGATIQFGK